jgi:hypothetical protein
MASRFTEEIDGEGVAWAAAGFIASLLIGVVIEPFRGTVGLENVALGYLLVVVVAAAVGGRAAGLISALSAALSYDFFLTTPYHSLRIDSVAQVITVALLFGTAWSRASPGERAGDGPSQPTPRPASSASSTRSPVRPPLVRRVLTVSPPKASTPSWTPAGW